MTAVGAVQALYAPITNSLYPHMVVGGDCAFVKKLALIALPFLTVGTIAFFLLAKWIVLVLGGEQYLDGAYVLQMLAPVLWLSFYGMYCGWPILGALGKVKQLTMTTIVSAVFGIAGLLALWVTGHASVSSFCVVRCLTEAIMCCSRVGLAGNTLRDLPQASPTNR